VEEHVIQNDDLLPVRALPALGFRMASDDGRLQLIRACAVLLSRVLEQLASRTNLVVLPTGPVLKFERYDVPVWFESRVGSRLVESNQGEETGDFRFSWHQCMELAGKPFGVVDQVTRLGLVRRAQVTLVQNQIDDAEHFAQPGVQFIGIRNTIWNAGRTDL